MTSRSGRSPAGGASSLRAGCQGPAASDTRLISRTPLRAVSHGRGSPIREPSGSSSNHDPCTRRPPVEGGTWVPRPHARARRGQRHGASGVRDQGDVPREPKLIVAFSELGGTEESTGPTGEPLHPRPQDRPRPRPTAPAWTSRFIPSIFRRRDLPKCRPARSSCSYARVASPRRCKDVVAGQLDMIISDPVATCCRRAGNITAHAASLTEGRPRHPNFGPSTRRGLPGTTSRCSMSSRCLRVE